jgi:hypothetical protein
MRKRSQSCLRLSIINRSLLKINKNIYEEILEYDHFYTSNFCSACRNLYCVSPSSRSQSRILNSNLLIYCSRSLAAIVFSLNNSSIRRSLI